MNECPCGSTIAYHKCCGRYLDKGEHPDTAENLMRSRYTAYVKNNAEYLLKTWHPETRPQSNSLMLDDQTIWTGLKVLATEQGLKNDQKGIVEFVAMYIRSGSSGTIREKSRFVREDDQWYYLDGETRPDKNDVKVKIGRNNPCPCGSGRKYKKCCLPNA